MERAQAASLTSLILHLAAHPRDHRELPPDVVLRAKHSLADWFACALAGSVHEDAQRVRAYASSWAAEGPCTVIGEKKRVQASAAALMNGFSGHVLDFDDVNLTANAHATAAVLPAVAALAEANMASGAKILDAFIAGYDAMCLLGERGGTRHYNTGWHASSVLGAFGSGVACAALLGMDPPAVSAMLGLALAQASGAQAVFGTPAKPFQVARAAEGGIHAALLAASGFAGHADLLDRERSLPALFSFEEHANESGISPEFPMRNTLLKFHASCFGTHAPVEAVGELQLKGVSADNLLALEIALAPHTANVCCIPSPANANELKFSVAQLCAMRLAGMDTGTAAAFTDATATDRRLRDIAGKVNVVALQGLQTAETEATATLQDGRKVSCRLDMGVPEADLAKQAARVERKFLALASPVVGERSARSLLDALLRIEEAAEAREILALAR